MLLQEIKETYRRSSQEAKTNCEQCYRAFHDEQNAHPNLVYTTADADSFNATAMNELQKMINISLNNKNDENFSEEEKQLLEELKNQKLSAGQALNSCVGCAHESKRIIRSL